MTFSYCLIRSRSAHCLAGGRFTANQTNFDFGGDADPEPGFWSTGTTYSFTTCEVIGSLYESFGSAIIDSCRWLQTPHGRRIGVTASGPHARMTETYVQGTSGAVGTNGSEALFEHNTVNHALFSDCSVRISNCIIGQSMSFDHCPLASVHNTTVGEAVQIDFSGNVTMDSCQLVPNNIEHHYSLSTQFVSRLEITRSIISLSLNLSSTDEIQIDHNTIIFDSTDHTSIDAPVDSSWTNNIFIALIPQERLFTGEQSSNIKYNCVWGFEYVSGTIENPIPIEEIDSTNLIADPLLVWNGLIPSLTIHSPCVDRGDPDAQQDPDETRSDIGARFLDQRLSIGTRSEIQVLPIALIASAFPNPFNNNFNISFSSPNNVLFTIKLFDLLGRVIYAKEVTPFIEGKGTASFIASIPSGRYLLLINNDHYTNVIPINCVR